MRVITTHINTDFDGLASMVAAGKLYPDSTMVFPGRVNDNVREFISLYKDIFPVKKLSQINPDKIKELVVVDTQQAFRLGLLSQYIEQIPRKIIYDHHSGPVEDIIENAETFIDSTGSTVTILMEIIIRGDIKITPTEATLFALGLYEDTGCFTFSSTTVREITVLKILTERGLDFRVIRKFIGRPLNEKQKYLLELLMNNTEVYEFKGIRTAVAAGEIDQDIRGLSFAVSKLMEIFDVDLIMVAVKMIDKIHLVGRGKTDRINLKDLFEDFGGGGHESAASAVLKDISLTELKSKILTRINYMVKPAVTAANIMSYPVRSISPKDTIEEAWKMVIKYGHSGFPVTEKGVIVGIISRRDLEKAKYHGLSHAPVKGFMSRKVQTARTDTPLREIEEKKIDKDIGRLPVTDDREKILGIVTRSDVLKVRYKKKSAAETPRGGQEKELENLSDLTYLINKRLPKKIQGLLFLIGQRADNKDYKVYAVGGFVRDLILNDKTYDIDLVVEPDAIAFAREINKFLDGRLTIYEQFGTAKIVLRDGLWLDLASARTEFYVQPGALPQVELSSIKQDLYRRDFTINTLAVQLNIDNFGKLVDYFGGLEDLKNGIIRVLYNLSFVDDPLRILRAVRIEQRLNFQIEEETMSFLKNAVNTRVIDKVSRFRLFEETTLIFQEKKPVKVLRRLYELNIMPFLFPRLKIDAKVFNLLEEVQKVVTYFMGELKITRFNKYIPYLCALYFYTNIKDINIILFQMRLKREIKRTVYLTLEKIPGIMEILSKPGVKPSSVYEVLNPLPLESLIFLSACSTHLRVWGYIKEYLEKLQNAAPFLTGQDLKELGYRPGPLFKEVLEELKKANLDGLVKNRDDEIKFVVRYMDEKKEVNN